MNSNLSNLHYSKSSTKFFDNLGGILQSKVGNKYQEQTPITRKGEEREAFLNVDSIIDNFIGKNGVNKTYNGQGVQLTDNNGNLQSAYFTPVRYYNLEGSYRIENYNNPLYSSERYQRMKDGYTYDENLMDFKLSLDDYNFIPDGGETTWTGEGDTTRLDMFVETPIDNEDPVFFGFEIVINTQTSPLFNGELETFIEQFSDIEEIRSRLGLVSEFKTELKKYIKLDTDLGGYENYDELNNINGFPYSNKRYYLKKIVGLNSLIESNISGNSKAFIDQSKDKLVLNFYEDVTLNMGYLSTLYKQIYWSKLRGKSIIPENLLRFDCEIIVSEVRNLLRYKKENNLLVFLKDNLNRYRYQLWECQFWFNKTTHGDTIDLSNITTSDLYEVELTFKSTNTIFEKFNGVDYSIFRNSTINPLVDGYREASNYIINSVNFNEPENTLPDNRESTIDRLKKQAKEVLIEKINTKASDLIDKSNIPLRTKRDIYKESAEKAVDRIKTALLTKAQDQINVRAKLLNDTLDKVRNRFGMGRMSEPTNIYNDNDNALIKNALRDFAGDILSNAILNRNN